MRTVYEERRVLSSGLTRIVSPSTTSVTRPLMVWTRLRGFGSEPPGSAAFEQGQGSDSQATPSWSLPSRR
jgi:hypothetical protein